MGSNCNEILLFSRSSELIHEPASLSPLRLSDNPIKVQSSTSTKGHRSSFRERRLRHDSDESDEDEPFTMEIETPGSGARLAGSSIDSFDEPMDLSADSDPEDNSWSVNSRVGLNSPLAWAVDGHIRVSDELSGRMASGIVSTNFLSRIHTLVYCLFCK